MKTGQIIDRMLELRDKKAELNSEIKTLTEEFNQLEQALIKKLQDEETNQGRSTRATASISSSTIANIENWDEFQKWMLENNAIYMMQKRVSNGAYRELLQTGEEVPGLRPFTQTTISLKRL
jgi:septal ring factor EnvC (AmiA/AmiB activator)